MWVRCRRICIFWDFRPGSGGMKDSRGNNRHWLKEWQGRKLGHVRHRFITDLSWHNLPQEFFLSDINITAFPFLPRLYVSIFVRYRGLMMWVSANLQAMR
jgi:hypothetical protein